MTVQTYTNQQKFDAVERELKYRVRVYARRVAEGKMTAELAKYQQEIFQAIAEDYRAKLDAERLL